jgi:hypothetical protein
MFFFFFKLFKIVTIFFSVSYILLFLSSLNNRGDVNTQSFLSWEEDTTFELLHPTTQWSEIGCGGKKTKILIFVFFSVEFH